jgi:hypothetical protein
VQENKMPTIETLKNLRIHSDYQDAPKVEQEAWFIYASRLVSVVVPSWKRNKGQAQQTLSERVTCSDEAFLLWVIQLRSEEWAREATQKKSGQLSATDDSTARSRGKHYSSTEIGPYNFLFNQVKKQRESNFNRIWELELKNQFILMATGPASGAGAKDDQSTIDSNASLPYDAIPMDDSDDE